MKKERFSYEEYCASIWDDLCKEPEEKQEDDRFNEDYYNDMIDYEFCVNGMFHV